MKGPTMTTPAIDETKLTRLVLDKGKHQNPTDGLCLMEAVAYLRGVPHTDSPACVSQVLGEMGRILNDLLPDDTRQQLIPLIPVLSGTAGDGHDKARSYMALDWLVRMWLPSWLELSPSCRADAARVRELDCIVDFGSAKQAQPVVRAARDQAVATRIATRIATEVATEDAARDAAREALSPTVTALQLSAVELYRRMAEIGRDERHV